MIRPHWVATCFFLAACGQGASSDGERPAGTERGFEPPVATNAESPVAYPPQLYADQVEGTVVLRLFVDADGTLVPESTRVAEGSGFPQLDSAAVRGTTELEFAPARRNGVPVATVFLQPVLFRHPERAPSGG